MLFCYTFICFVKNFTLHPILHSALLPPKKLSSFFQIFLQLFKFNSFNSYFTSFGDHWFLQVCPLFVSSWFKTIVRSHIPLYNTIISLDTDNLLLLGILRVNKSWIMSLIWLKVSEEIVPTLPIWSRGQRHTDSLLNFLASLHSTFLPLNLNFRILFLDL